MESQACAILDVLNPVRKYTLIKFLASWFYFHRRAIEVMCSVLFHCLFRQHKELFLKFLSLPMMSSELQLVQPNKLYLHGKTRLLILVNASCSSSKSSFTEIL